MDARRTSQHLFRSHHCRPHGRAVFRGFPGRKDLVRRVGEATPRRQAIVQQTHLGSFGCRLGNVAHLCQRVIGCLADGQTTIDMHYATIRDRGQRGRLRGDTGDRQRSAAEHGVIDLELSVEAVQPFNHRHHGRDRVLPSVRLRTVGRNSGGRNLDLHATALAVANAEVRGHGDNDHLGPQGCLVEEILPGKTDTVFAVDGCRHPHCHVVGQSNLVSQGRPVDQRRQTALLVRCTSSEESASGDDASKRIVTPMGRVGDTDSIDVGVVGQNLRARPDPPEDVSHLVEMDIAVTE